MGFIHVAVAVLGLLSVGQSALVTSCESLTQPLEIQGREQLLGKWMVVAESTNGRNVELIKKAFQDNYWIKITAAKESDAVTLMGTSKILDSCISTTIKVTVENNTLEPVLANLTLTHSLQGPVVISLSGIHLLKTGCSDCLLFQSQNSVFGKTNNTILQLLSKRRNVTAAEFDEFKAQAECLNLALPYTLNPEGDVCPEPPSPETDETHFYFNGQSMEYIDVTQELINSIGGPEKFNKKITEALSKQD